MCFENSVTSKNKYRGFPTTTKTNQKLPYEFINNLFSSISLASFIPLVPMTEVMNENKVNLLVYYSHPKTYSHIPRMQKCSLGGWQENAWVVEFYQVVHCQITYTIPDRSKTQIQQFVDICVQITYKKMGHIFRLYFIWPYYIELFISLYLLSSMNTDSYSGK